MKKLLALLLALAMVFALAACGSSEAPAEEAPAEEAPAEEATDGRAAREPIAAADLKIGVILVHDENSGYDLAHIEGVQAAIAELGIDESQVIFKYNIPRMRPAMTTPVTWRSRAARSYSPTATATRPT